MHWNGNLDPAISIDKAGGTTADPSKKNSRLSFALLYRKSGWFGDQKGNSEKAVWLWSTTKNDAMRRAFGVDRLHSDRVVDIMSVCSSIWWPGKKQFLPPRYAREEGKGAAVHLQRKKQLSHRLLYQTSTPGIRNYSRVSRITRFYRTVAVLHILCFAYAYSPWPL